MCGADRGRQHARLHTRTSYLAVLLAEDKEESVKELNKF